MIFLHFERIPLLKHHQFGVISQPAGTGRDELCPGCHSHATGEGFGWDFWLRGLAYPRVGVFAGILKKPYAFH